MVNKMAMTTNDLTQRTRLLEERVLDPRSNISIDSLLDSIVALIYDSEGLKKTKNFDAFYGRCNEFFVFRFQHRFRIRLVHSSTREIRDKRVNFDDFETIKIIGRGAFGTVDLVRRKSNGQVYAMKTLSKFEMVKRDKEKDSFFFFIDLILFCFSVKTIGQRLFLGRTKHYGVFQQRLDRQITLCLSRCEKCLSFSFFENDDKKRFRFSCT